MPSLSGSTIGSRGYGEGRNGGPGHLTVGSYSSDRTVVQDHGKMAKFDGGMLKESGGSYGNDNAGILSPLPKAKLQEVQQMGRQNQAGPFQMLEEK